jgi:hypothetical protein
MGSPGNGHQLDVVVTAPNLTGDGGQELLFLGTDSE